MTSESVPSGYPLRDAVVLVTGANRGIGRIFVRELIARGAGKVYSGARTPGNTEDSRIVPVLLDVTDLAQVAAAAERCDDVTVLINNAGVFHRASLLGAPSDEDVRAEMETNFFGTLAMTRAFAPALGRNGGGAVVNVLSVLSFINYAPWGSYSASKAAAWSLTNSARDELAEQGTRVLAVHAGLVDTDMTAGLEFPKITAETFVTEALDALEAGRIEALVDEHTRTYKAMLTDHPH